ncbi:MAG TPA: GDP-mannose 4,6-dehydratase [Noviherbaspirillum sp.]|jgi:GDPmannose 4,6-dehydratase|uniref:GDP-mannose 4,6-dehydratase n=1 Tax=Noviherbaspirillum sp. TaxID=1926288 RepID=UPI002F94C2F6
MNSATEGHDSAGKSSQRTDRKVAMITGVSGQDGAYLAEFLLTKDYIVHGVKRRTSRFNTDRIDHLYQDPQERERRFILYHGDMTDSSSLLRIIQETQPDEIYNLAAQSHVAVSFDEPEYTANSDALGPLRILETLRRLGMEKKTRFYQASTAEMFGTSRDFPQHEETPFRPRSPYAAAKLYAYWITVNYREAYGMHASNGIMFSHESPLRGETFVTRKITRGLARVVMGHQDCIYLGNLDARRDWGHARDYVEMMWRIVQQDKADDYVVATGEQHSVRDFVTASAEELGMVLRWEGSGMDEVAVVVDPGKHTSVAKDQVIVRVDARYFRPTDVDSMLGDASKARELLDWKPRVGFRELVREMLQADLESAGKDHLFQSHEHLSSLYHN